MSRNTKSIANWFLDRAAQDGQTLTQLPLQKLAYVAHGWHLADRGEPLTDEPVEAWENGPVFRSLYDEFGDYGANPIDRRATEWAGHLNPRLDTPRLPEGDERRRHLEAVWQGYRDYSAGQLWRITHDPGTPWDEVWNRRGGSRSRDAVIPTDLIRRHFEQKAAQRRATQMGAARAAG